MIDKLKFERIYSNTVFQKIPKELFEQMKYKDFEVDNLYKYAAAILLSPQTYFYTMTDEQGETRGILWATTEPVQNSMFINMMSVEEQFQGGGIEKMTAFLMSEIKKTALKTKLYWVSKRHKALSRTGWVSTGKVLMEFQEK